MKKTLLISSLLVSLFVATLTNAVEIKPTDQLLGVVPEPQQVYVFDLAKTTFEISSGTTITLPPNSPPLLKQASTMLTDDLKTAYDINPTVTSRPLNPTGFYLLLSNGDNKQAAYQKSLALLNSLPAAARESDEKYRLAITGDSILIWAPSEKGVFYGVQTLRQLLTLDGNIPAMLICDWPTQDIRASYGSSRTLDMESYIKKLASLKMNMAIVESRWYARGNWWYNPTGTNLVKAQEFFRLCRKYNVEPVPMIQGFGWAYGVVGINPNCSEGIWIRDEKQILTGQTEVTFNHPNVLVTKAAPIVITDTQKKQTYIEGKDYKIIAGKTKPRFEKSNAPWKIVRTADSQIKDGQTVVLSYNYMNYCNLQTPYCPLEPETYKIIDRTVQNVIEKFNPKYIHIGHDEVRYINRCSRCQQSGMTTDEIVIRDINHWYDQIKAAGPEIKIMVWNDLFIDHTREVAIANKAIFDAVPQDFIIMPWVYPATARVKKYLTQRLELLIKDSKRPTLGTSAGYTNDNIWLWKEAMGKYQGDPNNLGFIFSYWGEAERMWSSLNFSAEYMWSWQKPSKAVYQLYNESDLLCRKRGLSFALNLAKQEKETRGRIAFEITAGKNVRADAKILSKELKQRTNAVKKYILPAVANAQFHPAVNEERISRQMDHLSDFYQKLTADVWKQQSTPFIEFDGQQCIPLPIDDLKKMPLTENKNQATLDLGFTRSLWGVELQGKSTSQPQISLSRNGKTFSNIESVTRKTKKSESHLLTWAPQNAQHIKISSSPALTPKKIFALKKPAIYDCVPKKPSSGQWKSNAFWKDIAIVEDFVTRQKKSPKQLQQLILSRWRTTAQATYDAKNLYIRLECYFPDAKMLEYNNNKTAQSATPIWENDCVQIFVKSMKNPEIAENAFNQVIVNAGGNKFSKRHFQDALPVDIEAHSEIHKNHWTSVMAIPLTWFDAQGKDLAGKTWKINFGRTQRYPKANYSSWAMLPPGTMLWFLQPNYFGELRFKAPQNGIEK